MRLTAGGIGIPMPGRVPGAGGGGAGLPTTDGLIFDYDARTLDGVLNDGDPVATWPDASGNGNDATQPTASAQPSFSASVPGLNGEPALHFASDRMLLPAPLGVAGSQNRTFIVVWANESDGSSLGHILGLNTGGGDLRSRWLFSYASNLFRLGMFSISPYNFGLAMQASAVVTFWLDGTSEADHTLRINGVEEAGSGGENANTGDTASSTHVLFSDTAGGWALDCPRALLYGRALTPTEIADTEAHLNALYGVF